MDRKTSTEELAYTILSNFATKAANDLIFNYTGSKDMIEISKQKELLYDVAFHLAEKMVSACRIQLTDILYYNAKTEIKSPYVAQYLDVLRNSEAFQTVCEELEYLESRSKEERE